MPHSFGYRARTRHLFKRGFRKHGPVHMSQYLTTFKIGEYVDLKGNGAIHKGMPHKYYHGRTGIIWNVTPRAVGVLVNKQVRNRIIPKKLHVRIEHVQKSRCKEDLIARVKANEKLKADAKANKTKYTPIRRQHGLPRAGHTVKARKVEIESIGPVKFEELL